VHFGKKFKLYFSRVKYSPWRKQTCHSGYRRHTLVSRDKRNPNKHSKNPHRGWNWEKNTSEETEQVYLWLHYSSSYSSFGRFFRFEWKTTSKRQFKKKSVVKLHLPKLSANIISSLSFRIPSVFPLRFF